MRFMASHWSVHWLLPFGHRKQYLFSRLIHVGWTFLVPSYCHKAFDLVHWCCPFVFRNQFRLVNRSMFPSKSIWIKYPRFDLKFIGFRCGFIHSLSDPVRTFSRSLFHVRISFSHSYCRHFCLSDGTDNWYLFMSHQKLFCFLPMFFFPFGISFWRFSLPSIFNCRIFFVSEPWSIIRILQMNLSGNLIGSGM